MNKHTHSRTASEVPPESSPEAARDGSDLACPSEEPTWFRGLSLAERLESLRRAGGPHPESPDDPSGYDPTLARRRVEHWRNQPGLDDDEIWERRLSREKLSEAELLTLAGEPPEAIRDRSETTPTWLEQIARAYTAPVADAFPWPEDPAAQERSPFLPLVEPLVQQAFDRLLERTRRLVEGRSFDPPFEAPFEAERACRALTAHLPEDLAFQLNRVLVVELHVAKAEERLPEGTPRERFEAFRSSLYRREVALDVLARYPVLARALALRLEQWREASFEMLEHLVADADELRQRFTGRAGGAESGDLGRLAEVTGSLSDPHHGGRSVLILRFDGGRSDKRLRIVYKPRSLAVERAFQELLSWLSSKGWEPPLAPLEVFDAGDHGWMEYMEPAACTSSDEVRRYFLRQGANLALLHLLDGTDVHHENLIAAGEHPVIVDLETLFHPPVDGPTLRDADHHPGAPLRDSVLASGLLPQRIWGSRERAGVDISGMGSRPGQLTPQPVLTPTEHRTDGMRFERRQVEIPLGENRPRLQDREIAVLEHGEAIEEGYTRLFRLLTAHRDELTAEDGPLAAFAGAPVRVLFRPTAGYGSLMVEATHPHVAGNALERDRLYDRLWAGIRNRPYLETLIPFEQEELARGDVPRFVGRPDSRDLWTGTGERLPEVFDETGLERVRRRLAHWSDRDLERQRNVIRSSLEVLRLSETAPGRTSYPFRPGGEPASANRLLEASEATARRLLDLAFQGPAEALWLMIDHGEPEGWKLAPTRPDLYLGLPGIALFLGYLGELTGADEYRKVARLALRSQALQIEHDPESVTSLGILNGWGGVLYALTHLGVLWRDGELLDQAESFLDRLPEEVARDEVLDLGAGSAGCLLSLLTLAEHRPSDLLRSTALRCGERLLETAQPQRGGERRGLGWVMPLAGNRPLAGMSHGAAGIALALLRLGAATGDERFRRAAVEGVEFERSLFDREMANWPDLRAWNPDAPDAEPDPSGPDTPGQERFMCAWCHGAPGVGLARISGLPHLDDDSVREEIRVAVRTTLQEGFGDNHSLCHGDLGNLDFLLSAARALDDRELLDEVYRRAAGVLDGIEETGWLFGLPGNVETPGLMVGLAGIGYGLARLAA
ncbi:MAG: type 2 lanthipeptide synthetase LanM family protein, partial [Gemmatimonadota bacterium]